MEHYGPILFEMFFLLSQFLKQFWSVQFLLFFAQLPSHRCHHNLRYSSKFFWPLNLKCGWLQQKQWTSSRMLSLSSCSTQNDFYHIHNKHKNFVCIACPSIASVFPKNCPIGVLTFEWVSPCCVCHIGDANRASKTSISQNKYCLWGGELLDAQEKLALAIVPFFCKASVIYSKSSWPDFECISCLKAWVYEPGKKRSHLSQTEPPWVSMAFTGKGEE